MVQHQCRATLLLAKYSCPLLSAAVQNRLIAGLCCCKYTYGDLLLTQVCSGPTPVQCQSAFGKAQLPLAHCCCAKQADSRLVLLQIHLWRFALDTGVQWSNTSAVPHCFWQNTVAPAQCCCAKQADSRLVLLQIHLWRFALDTGVQWSNTSAVPHCFWQSTVAPCSHRCAVIQHQAAVQNRLTAGLCCCKYTYGDLLLTQVCSGPTPVQCHTAFGKAQLPLAHCCCAKQADSRLVLLQIHLWRFALDTGVQWSNTSAVPHCFWQNTVAPCSVLLCKTG